MDQWIAFFHGKLVRVSTVFSVSARLGDEHSIKDLANSQGSSTRLLLKINPLLGR